MATLMEQRDVSKCNTTNVATFDSPLVGHLGIVQDGIAHYYKASTRRHTQDSVFDVSKLSGVASVVIMTSTVVWMIWLPMSVVATNPDGLILTGAWSWYNPTKCTSDYTRMQNFQRSVLLVLVVVARYLQCHQDALANYLVCDNFKSTKLVFY